MQSPGSRNSELFVGWADIVHKVRSKIHNLAVSYGFGVEQTLDCLLTWIEQ